MELPLFPLNTVLFPGATLPLHIFEPRYRIMIGECVERESAFGVVLIQSGPEVGEGAVPHQVGVTARIGEVERMPDGRMNIVTTGLERFRILDTSSHRPYLTGEVELLADEDAESGAAYAAAERARERYLRFFQLALTLRGEWTQRVATVREPGRLADSLASRLPAAEEVKQALLEELSVPRRLDAVSRVLDKAIEILTPRAAAAQRQRYTGHSAFN